MAIRPINRRTFVLGGLAVTGAAPLAWQEPASAREVRPQAVIPYPFKLGVASGDPDASSVVLWTRLAPSPLNADGHGGMGTADVPVDWQVATDERFSAVVASGTVTATHAAAHSVHVVAQGLNADYDYFYRFRAEGHLSPVGRTRTAPAMGTAGRPLVMTFSSCQSYPRGYFTAHRRMAEENPGLVLFLGDYIYENPASIVRTHAPAVETVSLAEYRVRYAQYKADPDLQASHAAAPWVVVPDDHEVENDYAGMVRYDSDPPLTHEQWVARRSNAYRAYYENMPLRPAQANNGNSIQLYRRVHWGSLATFHMLDLRQYRDVQTCGGGWKNCPDADLPGRSLPGFPQEAWLLDGLAQHYGTWDILGQQNFFARRLRSDGAMSMDAWDGYRPSRARIQQGWVDRGTRNPVVLTGDVHRLWASNIIADYDDPDSAVIGSELVGSSIASGGDGNGDTTIPDGALNPWVKCCINWRGYVKTTITPTQIRADFRTVDKISEHGASARTMKSFVIEEGRPGLQSL